MIDLAAISAIDMHVHAETSIHDGDELRASGNPWPSPNAQEVADYYRSIGMAAVIFPVDAEVTLGRPAVPNEEVANIAAENSDVLVPFGSINPARQRTALTARRLVEVHSVRGFKFHPSLQEFYPNDQAVYPLYAELESLQVPVIFHTGQSGGGKRVRLKYSDPLYLDDVAVDFPDLRIVMAHPSFPWQDVALSIASRRQNVFIDLSGWSPKYFPPQLVQYANTLLKDKVLFGSDYPVIEPLKWLEDFENAGFRDAVKPGILKDNAARLLGLKDLVTA
jgi:uncharacterized protein